MKITKERCIRDIRKYSLTNRVVDIWNSLPEGIVEANSVHQFENRLDKLWEEHPMKFDYTSEYKPHALTAAEGPISDDTVQPHEELPTEDLAVLRAETPM